MVASDTSSALMTSWHTGKARWLMVLNLSSLSKLWRSRTARTDRASRPGSRSLIAAMTWSFPAVLLEPLSSMKIVAVGLPERNVHRRG